MGIGPEEGRGEFLEWYLCAPAWHRPGLAVLYRAYFRWLPLFGRRAQGSGGRKNLLKARQVLAEKRRLRGH